MTPGNGDGQSGPVINIVGETIALGPVSRDYLDLYQRWGNDFAANVTLGPMRPQPREATEAWYGRVTRPGQDDYVAFTIFVRDGLRPIGTTNLHHIDHRHRTAEFGIGIGEPAQWGKGYGTETARLMLDYGFTALNLHSIMLLVYSFNERGIRAYRRAGFREIGRRRQAFRLAGTAYDIVYMECLATEFDRPVLSRLLPV